VTLPLFREKFTYDPESGIVLWKKRYSNAISPDLSLGMNSKGYRNACVGGRNYAGHHIAWALHHGRMPCGQIDHINHDRSDNRIVNLREVTPAQNQRNSSMDRRNTSGVTGVRWRGDRKAWEATIRVSNKPIYLGRHASLDAIRCAAERKYGFHANHGRAVAGKKAEARKLTPED